MARRPAATWDPSWAELFQWIDWQSAYEPEEPIAVAFLEDPAGCLRDARVRAYLCSRKGHLHTHAGLQRDLGTLIDFDLVSDDVREGLAYLLLAAQISSEKTMGAIDYSNPKGLDGIRRRGRRLDRIKIRTETRTAEDRLLTQSEALPPWLTPHKALVVETKRFRNFAVWAIANYLQAKLGCGPEAAIRKSVVALNLVGLGVPNPPVKHRSPRAHGKPIDLRLAKPLHVAVMRVGLSALKIESAARRLLSSAGWDLTKAKEANEAELLELQDQFMSLQASKKDRKFVGIRGHWINELKRLQLEQESRCTLGFKALLIALIDEHKYIDGLVDQYRRYRRASQPPKQ